MRRTGPGSRYNAHVMLASSRSTPGGWIWLFPITYCLHISEEYWGGEGFPRWISRVAGAHLSEKAFLGLNCIGILLMTAGLVLLRRGLRWRWTLSTLGAVVLLNGSLHLAGSIITRSYSPGLITGLLVWDPLGGATLWFEWRNAPRMAFQAGILAAIGLNVLILLLSYGWA
jgi:hypothetical protein